MEVEGLMIGLELSPDNKFAAAYTNNNQTILLNTLIRCLAPIHLQCYPQRMNFNDDLKLLKSSKLIGVSIRSP